MLADVSHELKTPLATMRAYVETLQMADVDIDAARRARYLETVARETGRLEHIVADLVDLARYENDVATFDARVFAVSRVFEHVVQRHERDAQARRIDVATHIDEIVDQMVGDPDRIEQVIDNLMANALRHTPEGGRIRLDAVAERDTVVLSIVDSGSGIAPEHLPHVFDRFYKIDASRAAGSAGSGLGLSIVKAIVERHGGTITVASVPGRTAFRVVLPQPSTVTGTP
jgi:signal transduction histidine kinase